MNNIATLTAQPQVLRIDDKEYRIHPLTFADLGELQSWIDSQFPDPFEVVSKAIRSGNFNYAQQQFMLDKAIEKAMRPRHLIGTPEADELLLSAEGYKRITYLSIRKGDPSFTEKDADDLFDKMTEADLAKLGIATNIDMVATDPKDTPPQDVSPRKQSGSATSRKQRRAAAAQERRGTGGATSTK